MCNVIESDVCSLCHTVLVRSKSQVLLVTQRQGIKKGTSHMRGHLRGNQWQKEQGG